MAWETKGVRSVRNNLIIKKVMEVNAYIVDNFYSNVDEVREFALQQDFGVRGNYPGQRTEPFLNQSVMNTIESILEPQWGKIIDWGDEYTGAYQYTTAKERSWIHCDHTTRWAGVCYLTPNAPLSAGTGLFKHKETGLVGHPLKEDGSYDRELMDCLLYTSPSPRDVEESRMPSSA